jgi:hypothetical protein
MILQVFVVVFFNGFVLILSILSVMRGLYALGVCRRPLSSTDHVTHISLDRVENQTHQSVTAMTEPSLLSKRGFAQFEVRINRPSK